VVKVLQRKWQGERELDRAQDERTIKMLGTRRSGSSTPEMRENIVDGWRRSFMVAKE
jgi:hypothetical protein